LLDGLFKHSALLIEPGEPDKPNSTKQTKQTK